MNYYPSSKKHLAVYNTQQRRIITCLQQTTRNELLPVYNTQQREIISCLKQTTNKEYYLSNTKKQIKNYYMSDNKQQRGIITCL